MRISFALTKEYEVFIYNEEIDKKYGGDVVEAIKDKLKEAKEIDIYTDDITILEKEFEYEDGIYVDGIMIAQGAEKELQKSQYLRDLI